MPVRLIATSHDTVIPAANTPSAAGIEPPASRAVKARRDSASASAAMIPAPSAVQAIGYRSCHVSYTW